MNTYKELISLGFDRSEAAEAMEKLRDGEKDFAVEAGGGEYRFILEREIDEIQKEELLSDEYVLGCFTPWFIADVTGLDTCDVEKAQKSENFELLGALMAKNIDEVQKQYSSADGYGHHFSGYDGSEVELGDYYVFRTN